MSIQARSKLPRSFRTLIQAEEENGQSRTYLGVHYWQFDLTKGRSMSHKLVDYMFQRGLVPPAN